MDNSAIARVCHRHGINFELKPEQYDVISMILVKKMAVMAFLPTGYGKSLLYMWTRRSTKSCHLVPAVRLQR